MITDELELSVRASKILKTHGIETLVQFMALTKEDFMYWPGAGARTWKEIADLQKSLQPEGIFSTDLRSASFHLEAVNWFLAKYPDTALRYRDGAWRFLREVD